MIYTKIVSYLLPIALATTTPFITPDRGFRVGVGEEQITTYLEAEYVPSIPVEGPVSPKTALYEVFGADADIMWQIALCESGGRQFDVNGKVIQGRIDPDDTGLFQINKRYHLEESIKQGYDITTLKGNTDYAHFLFTIQGLKPWSASSGCWSKL